MSNAVYAHKETSRRHPNHRYGEAKTSARAIRRKKRQLEVLTYRLHGHSYQSISKQMKIPASTACEYAIRALSSVVPVELPKQVLAQELLKLDSMQTGIYQQACNGDAVAIESMLSIMRMRARLCGLIDTKHPERSLVNLNFGALPGGDAEDVGIRVEFIRPDPNKWQEDREHRAAEAAKVINGNLLGLPDLGDWKGPKSP